MKQISPLVKHSHDQNSYILHHISISIASSGCSKIANSNTSHGIVQVCQQSFVLSPGRHLRPAGAGDGTLTWRVMVGRSGAAAQSWPGDWEFHGIKRQWSFWFKSRLWSNIDILKTLVIFEQREYFIVIWISILGTFIFRYGHFYWYINGNIRIVWNEWRIGRTNKKMFPWGLQPKD